MNITNWHHLINNSLLDIQQKKIAKKFFKTPNAQQCLAIVDILEMNDLTDHIIPFLIDYLSTNPHSEKIRLALAERYFLQGKIQESMIILQEKKAELDLHPLELSLLLKASILLMKKDDISYYAKKITQQTTQSEESKRLIYYLTYFDINKAIKYLFKTHKNLLFINNSKFKDLRTLQEKTPLLLKKKRDSLWNIQLPQDINAYAAYPFTSCDIFSTHTNVAKNDRGNKIAKEKRYLFALGYVKHTSFFSFDRILFKKMIDADQREYRLLTLHKVKRHLEKNGET